MAQELLVQRKTTRETWHPLPRSYLLQMLLKLTLGCGIGCPRGPLRGLLQLRLQLCNLAAQSRDLLLPIIGLRGTSSGAMTLRTSALGLWLLWQEAGGLRW